MWQTTVRGIASFTQVQQFLTSFIDNLKSDHLYVVWQTNDPNNTRLCTALGDLPIYTKRLLAHEQHNYTSERLAKCK